MRGFVVKRKMQLAVVILMALVISGCGYSPRQVKYNESVPDKIVHNRIIEISDPESKSFEINHSEPSISGSNRATLKASVSGSSKRRFFRVREVKYIDYLKFFKDPEHTIPIAYHENIHYVYLPPDTDVNRLITPRLNGEKRTRYVRYTKSLMHDTLYGGELNLDTVRRLIHFSEICSGDEIPCDVDTTDFTFISVKADGKYNDPLEERLKSTKPRFPRSMGDLRLKVANFVKGSNFFPMRTEEVKAGFKAEDQTIRVTSAPEWMLPSVSVGSTGAVLEVGIKGTGRSFTLDPVQLGGSAEYESLLGQFVDKRTEQITVTHPPSGAAKTIPIPYYDGERLIAEIARIESLGQGYVRLTANMDNVDVYVDGVKKGTIRGGRPFVAKLVEGVHKIQAKKDFFGSKTLSVRIEDNDAFAYHFDLKESGNLSEQMGEGKIVQSTGELVVVTERNDFSVQIDGLTRTPPFKLPNISSGMHKMKITGPRGVKIVTVTVNEDQKALVDLDELY